jgi:murein tripeptide amidase MpaA
MTGAFDDWAYDQLGIFAWTTELWDIVGRSGIKDRKFIDWYRDHPEEDDLAILRWNDENLGGAGFVNWSPFDHPQLGRVEIGGWDTLWTWRNPPPTFLEEEIEKNCRFSLVQASMAPRLKVRHLAAEPVGGGASKITLVIENAGFLPTYVSRKGLDRKMSRPVRIEIEGGVLVSGERVIEVGHLEGRSNKLDWTSTGATDNRIRREWVVRGEPGDRLVLHVISERAGSIHPELTLA